MNVLVDTSVWSLALRRKRGSHKRTEKAIVAELTDLVADGRIVIIGSIRQEILSGVKSEQEFEQLRERLADFDDEPLETADFEEAARCCNQCRAAGVSGSPADFLICAVAIRRGLPVFTVDADFQRYSAQHSFSLHSIEHA